MRRHSLHVVVVLAGLAGLFAGSPAAGGQQPQTPAPSFRAGVQLVLVDVVVRDKKTGQLVTDLTKTDFEIKDEGKPQTIESFASIRMPNLATGSATQGMASWPTTDRVVNNRQGRLIVFFISDPWIPFSDTGYLRDLLHRFVDRHMGDNDEVAIWPVTSRMPQQDFTADRARLDAVIDRAQGTYAGIPVPPDQLLANLDTLLGRMAGIVNRRKVVILLGGEVLSPNLIGTPLYENVLRRAAAANVGVYPIGVTGVVGMGEIIGPTIPGRALPSLLALSVLAQETGGVVANQNDVDRSLERIEQDAGSYYLIAFSPTAVGVTPNRLRRLTVKVHRSGTIVQARRGYMPLRSRDLSKAPDATVPGRAWAADPTADRNLPLRMHASCFSDGQNGDVVIVTLQVDASYEQLAGHSLEYSVAGTNSSNQIVDRADGAATIPKGTSPVDAVVVSALHLPHGLSAVKAVVRTDGLMGALSLNFNVPRFDEPLAMSDLELAPMSEHVLVAGNPPAFLTQHLAKPVSAERTFDADDTLAIYGEVYGSTQSEDVTAMATILDGAGRVQRRVALELAPALRVSISDASPLSYSAQLDLNGLDVGAYTLGVEVRDAEGRTNSKGIPFQIRAAAQ